MNDIELGRQALTYFHNFSSGYAEYGARSFADFLSLYGKKAEIYMDGIGLAIRSTGISDYQVKTAMQALASTSRGKIPKDHQAYIGALQNKAGQISYFDLTKTVVTDVAIKTVEGAQAVGDNVLGTLKILNFVWPIALLFFLYSWYGSKVSKVKK